MAKPTNSFNKWKWPITITILTFIISVVFSLISDVLLSNAILLSAFIILIFIILLGIIADSIGIAIAAANLAPFHSMSANKVKGAKQAVKLITNASKVTSILNDVVGDICGIISGSTIGIIVIKIALHYGVRDTVYIGVLLSGFVASLTVGGKAIGKYYALNHTNDIVILASKIMGIFSFSKGSK